MHARSLFAALTLTAALLAGCGGSNAPAPVQTLTPPPPVQTPAPVVDTPSASPSPVSVETHENHQDTIIQVAILLDTSSSMNGLLEQAKSQLWKLVNELGKANCKGKTPIVQVAVYEYGKSALSAQEGFVRKVNDLTSELDKVSEGLFQLRCNGGQEYCGWAIDTAVHDLQWSSGKNVYKVIFIAGNEPFSQGPKDFHEACEQAHAKGIIVNTIHCGSQDVGERDGWKDGAAAGDGRFLCLDQNQAVAQVAAPQDKELAQLSAKLNQSYVPYGSSGQVSYSRQAAMDQSNASLGGAVMAERAQAKASRSYSNESWDLVDAVKRKGVSVKDMKAEELPAPLQAMAPEAREAFVEGKAKERADVQTKIQQLSKDRAAYLASHQPKANNSIDTAMLSVAREQASKQGYSFK